MPDYLRLSSLKVSAAYRLTAARAACHCVCQGVRAELRAKSFQASCTRASFQAPCSECEQRSRKARAVTCPDVLFLTVMCCCMMHIGCCLQGPTFRTYNLEEQQIRPASGWQQRSFFADGKWEWRGSRSLMHLLLDQEMHSTSGWRSACSERNTMRYKFVTHSLVAFAAY